MPRKAQESEVEPSSVVRIVLGSVPPDLGPERTAVQHALTRLRDSSFPGLEWISFQDDDETGSPPVQIARCHVYIGLLAAQGSTIHFEPEYRRAIQGRLHHLVYIKEIANAAPGRGVEKPSRLRLPRASLASLIQSGRKFLSLAPMTWRPKSPPI